MWLPQKNENSEGPYHYQQTPPSKTEEAERVTLDFPKRARLLTKADFKGVFRAANRYSGKFLTIDYRFGPAERPKLGLSVSKRFGKAHDRNRFKRLVREGFRLSRPFFPPNLEINVIPRGSCDTLSLGAIFHDLKQFYVQTVRA